MLRVEVSEVVHDELGERNPGLPDSQDDALGLEVGAVFDVVGAVGKLLPGVGAEGDIEVQAHRVEIDAGHAELLGGLHGCRGIGREAGGPGAVLAASGGG